jgi:XTP/dITP diphosphohydrolase
MSIPRLREGDRLVLATHNAGKLKEFQELFGRIRARDRVGRRTRPARARRDRYDIYRERAHQGPCRRDCSQRHCALPTIRASASTRWDGKPGVYTAELGRTSNGRDFAVGMRRVEDALQAAKATRAPAERQGSFNATLCLAHPDGREQLYVGKVEGTLVWPPRGEQRPRLRSGVHAAGATTSPSARWRPEMKHSWSPGKVGLSHRARAFAIFVDDVLGGGVEHCTLGHNSVDARSTGCSAFMCTGRSAPPNAPIATSIRTSIAGRSTSPPMSPPMSARWRHFGRALTPGPRTVQSIFFGGGTPIADGPALGRRRILDAIGQHWTIDPRAEITLEANPTSVEADRFRGYRSAGVNRVSLGVQSLRDRAAGGTGPAHTVDEAIAAVRLAQSIFRARASI